MRKALIVVACAVWCAELLAHPSGTITSKDIDDAIAWGVNGQPAPYLLHHAGQPGTVNAVVVGAVYTPFLRVALAAKAAREAGRSFTQRDVPPSLLEPVAYVAFRWYCCDSERTDATTFDPFTPFDYQLATPGYGVPLRGPSRRVTVAPLWIKRDLSILASFGGDLPYRDVVLLAGYPMSALATPQDFVIYREWPSRTSAEGAAIDRRTGRVTPEELARWR